MEDFARHMVYDQESLAKKKKKIHLQYVQFRFSTFFGLVLYVVLVSLYILHPK